MEPTTRRRPGSTLLTAVALTATAVSCSDDADPAAGDDHPFCEAVLAAEAATMTEDPAAIEAAFTAAADTAPDGIASAVDTVIAEATAGNQGSPDFTRAHGDLTDWVTSECGFAALTVTATDHAFAGFPDRLDSGPLVVEVDNDGTEFHQVMVMRINDDATAGLDDPALLSEDDIFASSTPVGGAVAAPDTTATGMLDLQPGSYLAICFLPAGATPENMPAIQAGNHHGEAHYTAGMVHRFTVT